MIVHRNVALVVIQPFSHYYNPLSLNLYIPRNPNLICCSTSARPPNRGSGKFNFDQNNRKRVWWSDDFSMDFEYDDDDYEGGGFGVLEDSFDTSFIWKVLNAFGWMVPAIAISMLLGTGGTNTFLMALVLPLAQSVVSFISDTFLGSSSRRPKPKRNSAKKKPFYRSRNKTGTKQDVNSRVVNENYQFRKAAKNKSQDQRASSFGGWDDLDKGPCKVPRTESTRQTNEIQLEKNGKLSRRVRTRETPLLVRLLIAVFPFLGSWTRLL